MCTEIVPKGWREHCERQAKDKLDAYIKRMNKELAEKAGKEQAAAKEKKAVCVRCGAEEAINSRRGRKGPGLVRSLGWTCGGCGGDECRAKEVEEEKALPIQWVLGTAAVPLIGFFNR